MTLARPPVLLFSCPACGAELVPAEGEAYITCAHCGTTGFVDLAGVLQHLRSTVVLSERDIGRTLHARGIIEPTRIELRYHPFWEFTSRTYSVAVDAAPDTAPEVDPVVLPTGERRRWDGEVEAGAPVHAPTLVPEAAAALAAPRLRGQVSAEGATLVHHPLYRVVLPTGEVLWLDGVEGKVLTGRPSEAATRGHGTGGLTFLVLGTALAAIALPIPSAVVAAALLAAAPWLLRMAGR